MSEASRGYAALHLAQCGVRCLGAHVQVVGLQVILGGRMDELELSPVLNVVIRTMSGNRSRVVYREVSSREWNFPRAKEKPGEGFVGAFPCDCCGCFRTGVRSLSCCEAQGASGGQFPSPWSFVSLRADLESCYESRWSKESWSQVSPLVVFLWWHGSSSSRTVAEHNVQSPNQSTNPSAANGELQKGCFPHLISHRQLLCSWCNYSDKTMWHNCWLLSWYHCCWLKRQGNNFIRDLLFFFPWQPLSIGADISDKAHYAHSMSPKTFYRFYLCASHPGEILICSYNI